MPSEYVQYFNVEKMGRFPNGPEALRAERMGVFTKLASVKDAVGGTVYVLSGFGKPKAYVLWQAFTVEAVAKEGDQYVASGPGRVLLPPAPLTGDAFEAFRAACANFVSFRRIDDQPFRETLRALAAAGRTGAVDAACEAFCDRLVKAFPKMGDAYYYRATVRRDLGNAAGATADFEQAVKLGTNFPNEARAGATGAPPASPPPAVAAPPAAAPAATPSASPGGGMAAQVLAKGVFAASLKKPAGVADAAWAAVVQRRGPEDLRQRLLAAYGGRCAVTWSNADAALEVAVIDPDAPPAVGNALPLRADVRTLFDLNLLRVHPRTKKVYLADAVKDGGYARLWGRPIRLPAKPADRPDPAALAKRWG